MSVNAEFPGSDLLRIDDDIAFYDIEDPAKTERQPYGPRTIAELNLFPDRFRTKDGDEEVDTVSSEGHDLPLRPTKKRLRRLT